MKSIISPSALINVLLLSGSLILLFVGWNAYRHHAGAPAPDALTRMDDRSAALPEELRSMFADTPPSNSQYAAVTERNLFSPERRPWAPPPDVSREAVASPPPPILENPRVRLYGTTITPVRRSALLYFESFSSQRKHRILEVGETARDEGDRGDSAYFVLVRLDADSAVLEDPHGREHVIGLYEHPRVPPPRPSSPGPARDATPAPVASSPAETEASMSLEPIRRMEDIPESLEEREQLAREGRLNRISTPFGPVFRPIQ
ncbi:hypothetical protein [Desulfonatronum thioautotrophicum]|uniref:hypothetical protein n=1 Tax=Desulfonatronum thioautotrophicum TaxID=617001 RepID=UPI0005EB9319|nr:hypothetical protein [Desulfonatronum thioautotrophicum]